MEEDDKTKTVKQEDEGMERRSFLKTLGGVIAATVLAAVNIDFSSIFDHAKTRKKEFESSLSLDIRSSDPENPSKGEMWLREDKI